MVRIIAIRLAGGTGHEHISHVKWQNSSESNFCSRAEMVKYINDGNKAYVTDGTNSVDVGVVKVEPPYLRTYADGKWSDNLLALPRF